MKHNHRGNYNYPITLDYVIAAILVVVVGLLFALLLVNTWDSLNALGVFILGSFSVSFTVVGLYSCSTLWSQWQELRYARSRSGVQA